MDRRCFLAGVASAGLILPDHGFASPRPALRQILLGRPAFDFYVDSVNGSDSNNGKSPNSAFKTLGKLPTIAGGQKVGLARGSQWREQLTISNSEVTIGAYGSGNRPILDASDLIAANSWSKTAGLTNVYNTGTITFIMGGTATAWVNVFETGGPGDSPGGQFLLFVADQATCDSTPGSYTIAGMSTAGGVPASAAIYIHTTDSTDPRVNGYAYEYANRRAGLYFTAPRGKIIGIEARKACSNSGAFDLDAGDGSAFFVDNCLARCCNDHAMFISGNSTVQNSIFLNSYWGGNSANLVVFFENTATGLPFYSINNIYQQDQNTGKTNTCILSHAGTGTNGVVTSINDWFIAKNSASLQAFFIQNCSKLSITGAHASEIYQVVAAYTNVDIANSQFVSAFASNTQINVQANNLTLNFNGLMISTKNDAHQVGTASFTGTVINDTNGIYYKDTPNASALDCFEGSTAALTFNGTTFDGAINPILPYDFFGTGATFTGGTTAGTANSYNATDHVTHFTLNNVAYTSLAAWQAAVSPQDSAAVTTRSGAAAKTLPTIPSVS